jgi:signal transduction histidine kinase
MGIEGDGSSMDLMEDNGKPQNLKNQLQQQELDPIHLNRNLELASQEDRALQRQREFLANTSHELRSPPNAILSFLRLVLEIGRALRQSLRSPPVHAKRP